MLGFKAQYIVVRSQEVLRYDPGQVLEFTRHGSGAVHTDECWSLPDDFGVWTFGPRSTLTLLPSRPMEGRAQAVFAINDAAVCEKFPSQVVRVLLNGRQIANWTLGPARDAGELRILLPAEALGTCEPVTIAFEIPSPRTPVQLGWSTWDIRPLGFRLSRFCIDAAGRLTYRLGEPIDFVEGGDSLAFVGDGLGTEWSLYGPRGSWTLGNHASFRLPLEGPVTGDLPCAFVISNCMVSSRAPKLPVIVKANGQTVAEWTLDNRRPRRQYATIPAGAVAGSLELTLSFEIAEPRSPESLGWSSDSRLLGFQLARAVIGRSEIEIPKFKAIGRERPMYQRILGLPQYAVHVARILAKRFRGHSD
jgi:hypothetical protein